MVTKTPNESANNAKNKDFFGLRVLNLLNQDFKNGKNGFFG